MILTFVPKKPDKAYIADRLWLPKGLVRPEPVKKALEFTVASQGSQILMRLWEESSKHVICPREFLPHSQYLKYRFPFVDLRPQFERVPFEDLVVPRNEEQSRAWQALVLNDNGILNMGCGKGKTKLGIKKIAHHGTPTLVIVPDTGIMDQWKESIFGNPAKGIGPSIRFDGELGIIQGTTFKWKRHLTLALVTTLWQKIEQGLVPEEMFRYFGMVIWDECHLIGAPKFSLTAYPFYGNRMGLTATVQREDGLDPIYRYNLGEPFYSDLSQDLIPRIYFQKTPVRMEIELAQIDGVTNISILRSMLGRDYIGNVFRYWSIRDALEKGRKLLCISHSKNQLRLMHAMFPGSSLIVAETKERMDVLRNSQICFAIAKLGSQGVDDDRLDTLFWLTPFRSRVSLQQSMGRIQRQREGKKSPVMVVFDDWQVMSLRNLCNKLKSRLKEWSFSFENLPPVPYPTNLPTEVQQAYDAINAKLDAEESEPDPEGPEDRR
jgi:superfamily II DNA or RNA helicase